ncbi:MULTISPECIES: META domain-containing protein [Parabacteroides]|uniref:META domain-containing protein n=1 Tax=Parabacteroides leei TaxID=2939491 RepID=UPI001898577D|nr:MULTISPECIES: META domain-containing protein [Parabacteroides]MCL3850682.1 META domain-containing protein [Parabacteroides leei]
MKKYLFLCLAVVGIAVFASCKSQKAVVATFSDLDGEWSVVELNGKRLDPADSKQLIVIDVARKHLSGNAGCNRMNGNIEYTDAQKNIIKFPQVATTRMACPDMKGEQEFLDALNKVVRFQAEGLTKPVNTVALYGTDNGKLMVIQKK